jgi:hypothetical protein
LLAFSVIIFVTATGFLRWPLTLGYMVLLLLATLIFHSRTLIVTFIGLSYLVFLYVTFRNLFPAFVAALCVGLFAVVFTRHRILSSFGPFLKGFKELFTGQHGKEKEPAENQKA